MTERGPDGKFVKGASGNPGGRPKDSLSLTALIDAAVTATDWTTIIGIMRRKAIHGDLKATDMLFDRRFGKAQQFTDITSNGETIHVGLKGEDETS